MMYDVLCHVGTMLEGAAIMAVVFYMFGMLKL
jgi:hypothetical protein